MRYRARIKWRGLQHPVQTQWKAAKKGARFPAPVQTYGKPGGAKIRTVYSQYTLEDLRVLQVSDQAFKALRRIGAVLFNLDGNTQYIAKTKKLIAKLLKLKIPSYIPYPLPKGKKAIAQGIMCDYNEVTVVEERVFKRKKWARILQTVARLTEVEIGSNRMFVGSLRWRVYPDAKTGEIWMQHDLLEKIL